MKDNLLYLIIGGVLGFSSPIIIFLGLIIGANKHSDDELSKEDWKAGFRK